MKLHKPKFIKKTNIDLSNVPLHDMSCGLFRAPLDIASKIMPELSEIFDSAPVENPAEWEVDVKIHMLMKVQYPCIPNWHCDNVPREEGKTRYDLIQDGVKPMYLWLSTNPTTEFLGQDWNTKGYIPKNHSELAEFIKSSESNGLKLEKVPSQTWISMDQRTPHRGTLSDKNQWRVFVRLTHNSIAPARPVANDYIRRHCQVYLNPETFSW